MRGLSLTLVLCLTACTTGPKLDEQNLGNVSLAGEWIIDFGASDLLPDLSRQTSRAVGASERVDLRRLRQAGGGLAFVAHDFQVLTADKLLIEQNRDSMGVRYTPGVYRDVTWGERQRGLWEVDAGFVERQLLIISKTRGIRVQEQFTLLDIDTLSIQVDVTSEGQDFSFRRVFNRRR